LPFFKYAFDKIPYLSSPTVSRIIELNLYPQTLLYLLSVVPVVGWIISIALSIVSTVKLAKAFNQSTAFIFGLLLLSPIFQMILGFGKAEYVGNSNNDTTNTSVQ
jgi:hypothetical protein